MFKELNISFKYRSDKGDIINGFYNPVLENSVKYIRAVGYFTSASLSLAARGMSTFINKGGKIKIIASPKLSYEDVVAIKEGYESKNKIIENALIRDISLTKDKIEKYRLGVLAWLIANDKLEIKIATLIDETGHGIFHEKIGLFTDNYGDKIAFVGSANETAGGLDNNFESIQVFKSYNHSEIDRVLDIENDLKELWNNNTNRLNIDTFEKVYDKIMEYYDPEIDVVDIEGKDFMKQFYVEDDDVRIPSKIKLREYQDQAICAWANNNYQGLFSMATGTGKTITALAASVSLRLHTNENILVIISCPYIHLVDQWEEDAIMFGYKPIIAYSSHNWYPRVKLAIRNLRRGENKTECVIVSNSTFDTDRMQSLMLDNRSEVLLIVDEAHNYGAERKLKLLKESYKYRLALSATPKRHLDEEGTMKLFDYFKGVVFEFSLKDAIDNEFLTKYYYYPEIVTLTDEENIEYSKLTKEIIRLLGGEDDFKSKLKSSPQLQMKLIERARLLSLAENKIHKLRELMSNRTDSYYNLIYCGAGTSKFDDESKRQIDRSCELLGNELEMSIHRFTSQEDKDIRKDILSRFKTGDDLQAIVAIKCLDEGVNIPEIETAYIMASSTNYREFVQRRGRVLRLSKGKNFAYIYDFITLPRSIDMISTCSEEEYNVERQIAKRELIRMKEFAELAINRYEGTEIIEAIEDAYNIIIEDEEE